MKPFRRPMKGVSLLPPDIETTDENIKAAMESLKYPVIVSEKMDGVRGIVAMYNDKPTLLSYRLKPIPNKQLQAMIALIPLGYDMELWTPKLPYNDIQSIVMSEEHPNSWMINFNVIDRIMDAPYGERLYVILMAGLPHVVFTPPKTADTSGQLWDMFLESEEAGQEGICFRLPNSPYKEGRSTLREQYLVKLCRWQYEEAMVIGFEEQMENGNMDKHNSIGLMERSHAQANMYGKNTLGAFKVRSLIDAHEFSVGTGVGLTDRLRKEVWENQKKYLGNTIKYKCKPHGRKDKPRSPIFWGFRNPID